MTLGPDAVDNRIRADVLQAVLQQRFWSDRQQLFAIREGASVRRFGDWHHWWQSHALAALLDRHTRTGDPAALRQAEALVEGIRRRNRGGLTNDFYDDMGWLALELLRMPGHDHDVRTLLAAIRAGEAPEGGIAWAVPHPEFRNTPATGPAALLALRLGQRDQDERLVSWGLSLVRWLEGTVVTPDADVCDGWRLHADGTTGLDTARYSYNYGLVAGAELAAHRVTGAAEHLDRARLVAHAAVRELADPVTGVWRDEGPDDRALFRGILARHVADVALGTDDAALAHAVRVQANAVWASCDGGAVGRDWTGPARHPVQLSEHLGALLVIESAARLG